MTGHYDVEMERTEDSIDETRKRISDRFDDLQNGLSPTRLMENLVPPGQPLSDTISEISEAARRNPVATALLAGGAILLGREVFYGRDELHRERRRLQAKDAAERIGDNVNSIKDASLSAVGTVRDASEAARDTLAETTRGASAAVSQAVCDGRDLAEMAAREARHRAYAGARNVSQTASTGRRWVEENPVATGLACVAVGALAASFFTAKPLPETPKGEKDRLPERQKKQAKKSTASKASKKKTANKASAASRRRKPATSRAKSVTSGGPAAKRPAPGATDMPPGSSPSTASHVTRGESGKTAG